MVSTRLSMYISLYTCYLILPYHKVPYPTFSIDIGIRFSRPQLPSTPARMVNTNVSRSSEPQMSPPVQDTLLFRPSKKRKLYRQRVDVDEQASLGAVESLDAAYLQPHSNASVTSVASLPVSPAISDVESTHVSMSEILRLRKARKPRIGGVEFRNSAPGNRETTHSLVIISGPVHDDVVADEPQTTVPVGRFATQTGTVGDVNKHM